MFKIVSLSDTGRNSGTLAALPDICGRETPNGIVFAIPKATAEAKIAVNR